MGVRQGGVLVLALVPSLIASRADPQQARRPADHHVRDPRPARRAILLDIQMQGGTGMEALKKLKASTKTASIPVLVLSGSAEPAVEENVMALGATKLLRKPVDVDTLYEVISAVERSDAAG